MSLIELKMVKLQKYCLNFFLTMLLISCIDLTNEEKIKKSDEMINGGHIILSPHYQGSVKMMSYTEEAIALNPQNADAWRELSIPYLKRGMPHKWKPLFEKAVYHDSVTWQPWRGYLYLWFYRDYKKAIADFDASDTLTPNFIDAPQGHSVDYWRGIAYLGLKNYEKSNWYFEKHIAKETEQFGKDYVDLTAFLYNGICYFEAGNYKKALSNFENQLTYSNQLSADAKFYKAQILKAENKITEAKTLIESAINDYKAGYYNSRPYVETLREIYLEDLETFKTQLTK